MKVVILAGGLGSRLSEETTVKPKPMVEIGGKPMLWHIMKIYAAYGIDDFIVCLGYKGYVIKEWFANYALHTSDVTFDLGTGEMQGTGFDQWNDAGGTGWLKTQAPITGGQEFTIRFAIWDTGDSAWDSTAVVDNFEWVANGGTVVVGTEEIPDPK